MSNNGSVIRSKNLSSEKLNKSKEGLAEIIHHHIPYEVRMMRQTYIMLADGSACLWFNQAVINALIAVVLPARSISYRVLFRQYDTG